MNSTKFKRFYDIINETETSFQRVSQTSYYFRDSADYFAFFIVLEYVVLWIQHKPKPRFNDTITSLSLGLLQECTRVLTQGTELLLYIYVYNNYRLMDLPPNSMTVWYLTAVFVDFGYYWIHRAGHEINLLWSYHQVHHSADDFNLAVGLRHGILNAFVTLLLYTPLALVIPPEQFIAHLQFNLIYQFWIHTEVVESLGPLEWILNTPRHHRVHHGCNKYLLDKNYGGIFIIWDRIFGTFREKLPEETIYGLVHPPSSFNPVYLQTYYYSSLWKRLQTMDHFTNKVEAIIKGPSWTPGSPWTGWEHFKISITKRPKYDVPVPMWYGYYLLIHFIIVVMNFQMFIHLDQEHNPLNMVLFIGYVVVSLTIFGLLLEDRPWSCAIELIRCIVYLTSFADKSIDGSVAPSAVHLYFYCSAFIWSCITLNQLTTIIDKSKLN